MVDIKEYIDDCYDSVNQLLVENFSLRKVKKDKDNEHVELVGIVDGKVVGYLLLTKIVDYISERKVCKVDYVCVNKDYRNQGVGSSLMKKAIDIALEYEAIYIELTSSIFREEARNLYEKLGFKVRESNIFRKELI